MNIVIFFSRGIWHCPSAVVRDVPKLLAPIHGISFLDILINQYISLGASKIFLTTHYMAGKFNDFLREFEYAIPVKIIHEPLPLGTGGSMANAIRSINEDLIFAMDTLIHQS